jgi:hypothetical protein
MDEKGCGFAGRGSSGGRLQKAAGGALSYEIDSPTNRRKAREILMRIWYLNSEGVEGLQEEGRRLIQNILRS